MKIKPIKQPDGIACGPTCIKMVANYFNLPITFNEIRKVTQYKKRSGLSDEQLVQSLHKLGFSTQTRQPSSWNGLKKNNAKQNVVVVSWMKDGYKGHFSIVEKVDDKNVWLADPDVGKIIKMKKVVFLRLWMGYDDMWYPRVPTDITLRFMAVVSKRALDKSAHAVS